MRRLGTINHALHNVSMSKVALKNECAALHAYPQGFQQGLGTSSQPSKVRPGTLPPRVHAPALSPHITPR